MVIKSRENNIGAWAFLIGVILAVIIGLTTSTLMPVPLLVKYNTLIYTTLIVLGIVVGFANIPAEARDAEIFLIAGAVIVIVSKFGMDSVTGSLIGFPIADAVKTVFGSLLTLFVPATIIVALKTVFEMAKI